MEEMKMISMKAFCSGHGISIRFVEELLEYGLVDLQVLEDDFLLPEEELGNLERMKRLHFDLGINAPGIGVVVQLLRRIEELEEQIRKLS